MLFIYNVWTPNVNLKSATTQKLLHQFEFCFVLWNKNVIYKTFYCISISDPIHILECGQVSLTLEHIGYFHQHEPFGVTGQRDISPFLSYYNAREMLYVCIGILFIYGYIVFYIICD